MESLGVTCMTFTGIFILQRVVCIVWTFQIFLQDFGDYSDSYYSVQTTEGERISQLIAGYIDIILKKVRVDFVTLFYRFVL